MSNQFFADGTKEKEARHRKGRNTYTKTENSKCQIAKNWWNEKHAYWDDVRAVWDELFAMKKTVSIKKKVDDKVLFMKLFTLEDEMLKDKYDPEVAKSKIRETINEYLDGDLTLASK